MVRGVKTGVSIALVGILAGGGGAYAATQITSAQIKDGTIQAKDIKRGTISANNLSAAAKAGMVGGRPGGRDRRGRRDRPAGPQGERGPSGARLPGHAARRATRARPARRAAGPEGRQGR